MTNDNLSEQEFEFKKLKITHLHEIMQESIKELRLLDRLIIVFTGAIWAFFIKNVASLSEASPLLLFIPFIVSLLMTLKSHKLLDRYYDQKKEYYELVGNKPYCPSRGQYGINNLLNIVVVSNLIIASYLIFIG